MNTCIFCGAEAPHHIKAALVITEFGKQYYRENWQRYRELYPNEGEASMSIQPDHRQGRSFPFGWEW